MITKDKEGSGEEQAETSVAVSFENGRDKQREILRESRENLLAEGRCLQKRKGEHDFVWKGWRQSIERTNDSSCK